MPESTNRLPQVGILIVDDRRENLLALEAVLEPLGQRVVRAASGQAALEAAQRERFAVILLDIRMPGLDGFETMDLLQHHERSRGVPIIFLTASPERHDALRSYSSGAVDYLSKPFSPDALLAKVSVFVRLRQHEAALESARAELEARVERRTAELAAANRALGREVAERKAAERRLAERSLRDELTGLPNQALFGVQLKQAFARWKRRRSNFAVLMMDLDRFRVVNDCHGRYRGDALLRGVAKRLVGSFRVEDVVARFGGDELAILLDDPVTPVDAWMIAERARARIAAPFELDGKEVEVSASIGVAIMRAEYESGEDVVRQAYTAMRRAKEGGGNRFEVFDPTLQLGQAKTLELELVNAG
jgi:diguanylate cyclase (GGDEF)-like protein